MNRKSLYRLFSAILCIVLVFAFVHSCARNPEAEAKTEAEPESKTETPASPNPGAERLPQVKNLRFTVLDDGRPVYMFDMPDDMSNIEGFFVEYTDDDWLTSSISIRMRNDPGSFITFVINLLRYSERTIPTGTFQVRITSLAHESDFNMADSLPVVSENTVTIIESGDPVVLTGLGRLTDGTPVVYGMFEPGIFYNYSISNVSDTITRPSQTRADLGFIPIGHLPELELEAGGSMYVWAMTDAIMENGNLIVTHTPRSELFEFTVDP